jgi:hypothetical protein
MTEVDGVEGSEKRSSPGDSPHLHVGHSERAVTDEVGPRPLHKPFNAGSLAGKIREVLDVVPPA